MKKVLHAQFIICSRNKVAQNDVSYGLKPKHCVCMLSSMCGGILLHVLFHVYQFLLRKGCIHVFERLCIWSKGGLENMGHTSIPDLHPNHGFNSFTSCLGTLRTNLIFYLHNIVIFFAILISVFSLCASFLSIFCPP